MDKIWHRGITKYLLKKELAPKDIHADMVATLGDTAPSYATAKKWAAHFKMGNESLEDDDRCGRSSTAATEKNIAHVVMNDRRLTLNQIAHSVGISHERVENISVQ